MFISPFNIIKQNIEIKQKEDPLEYLDFLDTCTLRYRNKSLYGVDMTIFYNVNNQHPHILFHCNSSDYNKLSICNVDFHRDLQGNEIYLQPEPMFVTRSDRINYKEYMNLIKFFNFLEIKLLKSGMAVTIKRLHE